MRLKKKALMIVAVALSAVVLAGYVGASLPDGAAEHPHNRANHHPINPNG